tara:strand:+ start:944 stop:1738 length:795 start_codon:yes stop_codon:yes gene_type:complete
MKTKTKDLLQQINQLEDIPERLKVLKDAFKGETCYIVTGGPSLKNYTSEELESKLKDKLVISIKQAFNLIKSVTDFHVLNFTNFQPYDYKDTTNIVVWEVFEQFHPNMILDNNLKCELMLPVTGNHHPDIIHRIDNSQAGLENFEEWELDKTLERMYGPGIMYETVIHLAVYLGVSKIITLGWDIGDVSKFKGDNLREDIWQDHFYEDTQEQMAYAPTPMNYHEVNTVVKSALALYNYLKNKGIEFNIISDRNPSSNQIPRTEL